jgi:hypothetical protein
VKSPMRRLRRAGNVRAVTDALTMIDSALLDAAFDCYIDWRDETAGVRAAYRRWVHARKEERGRAYAAYAAAVDREERASELYAAMLESCRERWRPLPQLRRPAA